MFSGTRCWWTIKTNRRRNALHQPLDRRQMLVQRLSTMEALPAATSRTSQAASVTPTSTGKPKRAGTPGELPCLMSWKRDCRTDGVLKVALQLPLNHSSSLCPCRQDRDIEAEDFQRYTENVQTLLQDCPVQRPPAALLSRSREHVSRARQSQAPKVGQRLRLGLHIRGRREMNENVSLLWSHPKTITQLSKGLSVHTICRFLSAIFVHWLLSTSCLSNVPLPALLLSLVVK